MKVTVEVTQADIKCGKRGSLDFCPIAFAINRLLRLEYKVLVDPDVLRILDEDGVLKKHIDLPARATEFIDEFDNEEAVSPISFTVDIPERFLRRPR